MNPYDCKTDGLIYCTSYGIQLLEKHNKFIGEVWRNDDCREFWLSSKNKTLTKIHSPDNLYIEKRGTTSDKHTALDELKSYQKLYDIISKSTIKHISTPKVYFAVKDWLLLDYAGPEANLEEVSDEVWSDYMMLATLTDHAPMEFCQGPNGTLNVIDPHLCHK